MNGKEKQSPGWGFCLVALSPKSRHPNNVLMELMVSVIRLDGRLIPTLVFPYNLTATR